MRDRRREAPLALPVHRDRPHAGRVGCVLVGTLDDPLCDAALHEGPVARIPLRLGPAHDRDRPRVAVVGRVAEVEIALQEAEPGQHLCPAPALRPVGEVRGLGAHGDAAVDRGGAAETASTQVGQRAAIARAHGLAPLDRPAVAAAEQRDLLREGVGRVQRAGLEEQDPMARVLRQPRGEHATRRAGAHDHAVEAHRSLPLAHASPTRPEPGAAPDLRAPTQPARASIVGPSTTRRARAAAMLPPR